MSMTADEQVEPALLRHSRTVYDAMCREAKPGLHGLTYEGFLTHLFQELDLSVPYYTMVMKKLKAMDCVRQLVRGGGSSPSQWLLLQEPSQELYESTPSVRAQSNDRGMQNQMNQDVNKRLLALEEKVDLAQELSVVLARGGNGETEFYPVGENVHRNGILHTTRVPGRVAPAVAELATGMARRVAEALDYVGVLAVEFFFTTDGELLINEMAPRPHNSGHFSLDACVTSQFEQQVRALCGLPLGSARLLTPVTMLNLLGDLWGETQPGWQEVFAHPEAKLHLYGKREARPGRKMGHINVLGEDADANFELAEQLFATLSATACP